MSIIMTDDFAELIVKQWLSDVCSNDFKSLFIFSQACAVSSGKKE